MLQKTCLIALLYNFTITLQNYMQTTFAYTIVNFNTLLIVNNKTQEQRYANNVTLQDLYSVTQAQLKKLFKTATTGDVWA